MGLTDFLRLILPTTGTYYTVQINEKSTRQFTHQSIEDAAASLMQINARHNNAFIATGSFKGKRTQQDCKAKCAWYIDIDCKPGKDYDDKKLAMAALKDALKGGLPQPSIIVDSGNGFHIYWVISDEVKATEWRILADTLDVAVATLGLKVDPTSTKDSARILRAPETGNYKDPKRPLPCEVKLNTGTYYTAASLKKAFEPFADKAKPNNVVNLPIPQGADDALWAGLPEGKPSNAQSMIDQCPLYAEAIATGGKDHAEPLWRGLIKTLVYVDDGADYIHKIGDQHADYNSNHTIKKYQQGVRSKADSGPYLCTTLGKHSATCQTCPYWGTIKTPLALAYGVKSLLPYPWRDGAYGVERYDPDDDEWTMTIPYHVSGLKVAHVQGGPALLKFVMDKEEIDTNLAQLIKNDLLATVLANHGIMLNPPNLDETRRLMSSWIKQLRDNRQIETAIKQFGWTPKGFHYGGVIYDKDGNESEAFKADSHVAEVFSPHGELEPWQKCANHILSQKRHAVWAMLASSFGAPLMKFTGVTGAVLSVVSQDTGTGKSTALRVAQGVWGHPLKGAFSIDDTTNLVAHRMGVLNNLPGFWDEVRGKDQVDLFIRNIFRMGQGQEKKRLTSNITERESGGWSTMLVIASNEALNDHIDRQVGNSDAGTARVFELYASAIKDETMNNAEAQHMYLQVEDNYGHAGEIYARWLAQNKDKAKELVQRTAQTLNKSLKTNSDERYWIGTMSCLLAGAGIANSLGICQFNMKEFKEYLIDHFKDMRMEKKKEWNTPEERSLKYLVRFLHQHKDQTIKSDYLPTKGKRAYKIYRDAIKQPAIVRVAKKPPIIRIIKEDFKQWLYEHMNGAGFSHVITDLKNMGAIETRGSVDAGTNVASSGRQGTLDFPCNLPALKEALGDWID